jgi:hypothetical protein
MIPTRGILLIAACVGTLAVTAPARAQSPDSNVSFESGILIKKLKPGAPDPKSQPLAWPRLDAGAVLCRSEADLSRLAARRSGQSVDGSVECQLIRGPTAISIVARKGPGRTEVQTTNPNAGGDGWTDAFLPDKGPSGSTSASR